MPTPLEVTADVDDVLQAADNAAMRTALGLGTAAVTDADEYATAAQGATADALADLNLSTHGTSIPSASTINLDTATGDLVDITGTTTITAITLAAGQRRILYINDNVRIVNSQYLNAPGALDIYARLGDMLECIGYTGGYVVINYIPYNSPLGSLTNVGFIGDSIMSANSSGFRVDEYLKAYSRGRVFGNNLGVASVSLGNVINVSTGQASKVIPTNNIVVIEGGVNDILAGNDWAAVGAESAFDALLAACVAARTHLIVEEIWPCEAFSGIDGTKQGYIEEWNANLRVWVRENDGVELLETYAAFGEPGTPEELAAAYDNGDGLHPNGAAIILHAQLLLEKLQGGTWCRKAPAVHVEGQTLFDEAVIIYNAALGANAIVTLTDNRTLSAPTNAPAWMTGTLIIVQDAGGGNTLNLSAYKWAGGTDGVVSAGAGDVDVLSWMTPDGTNFYATLLNDFS